MQIPQIEPFQFIRSTAFSERVQLANKINEIIDGINSIGEIPDIQAEIDAVKDTISQIQTELEDTNSDLSGLTNQVNTLISEVNGLLKEVISEVSLDSPGYGQVRVKVIHEDETETASNVLQIPVIQDGGITLISGTTDRSFKIQYVTTDGVTHTTNDFVIPEGGGTDVTVTSVSIEQGDTTNSFKFEIGLSDGSSIQSNSYPFPPGTELTPATTSQLGGIKVGTHLSVTADGTLSVDMTEINTAAVASTVMFTADTSKVTLHADSIAGSEFTKDIPQASQGGAGTIDAAAYQKLSNVPDPSTIATDSEISDLQEQITGLKLSKPNANQIQLNGDNVSVVESVSGSVDDDGNLVITVNGVAGAGIPLDLGPEKVPFKLKTTFGTAQLSFQNGSGTRRATIYTGGNVETATKLLFNEQKLLTAPLSMNGETQEYATVGSGYQILEEDSISNVFSAIFEWNGGFDVEPYSNIGDNIDPYIIVSGTFNGSALSLILAATLVKGLANGTIQSKSTSIQCATSAPSGSSGIFTITSVLVGLNS